MKEMSSLASIDTSASVYQPAQLLNWVYLTLADSNPQGIQNSQSVYSDPWTANQNTPQSVTSLNTVSVSSLLQKTNQNIFTVNHHHHVAAAADPWSSPPQHTAIHGNVNATVSRPSQLFIYTNYSLLFFSSKDMRLNNNNNHLK